MSNYSSSKIDPGITLWLDAAGRFPRLPVETVNKIANQIQALPESDPKRAKLVNKLVNHNLLLVANFVKKFMDRRSHNKWGSTETVDYLQVGTIGLHRAAQKFDPKRGYAFSTYASHWMQSTVGRYNLKTITPVHVSESAARRLIHYKRNKDSYPQTSRHYMNEGQAQLLEQSLANAYECVSLDMQVMDDGEALVNLLPCNYQEKKVINLNSIYTALRNSGVTPIAIQILKRLFIDEMNITQVANLSNLTVPQVRQHKKLAMELATQNKSLLGSV
jgi:RNA polymerase sigma factor (sigma-70 family)